MSLVYITLLITKIVIIIVTCMTIGCMSLVDSKSKKYSLPSHEIIKIFAVFLQWCLKESKFLLLNQRQLTARVRNAVSQVTILLEVCITKYRSTLYRDGQGSPASWPYI